MIPWAPPAHCSLMTSWLKHSWSKVEPKKEQCGKADALVSRIGTMLLCSFSLSLEESQNWSKWATHRAPSNKHQIRRVYVDVKLLMQIGWSYRVGSIKGDLDRLKLHSALIRQPAAMPNKWKSITFRSMCLCALSHSEEFEQDANSSSNFPQLPIALTALVSLPASLSIFLLTLIDCPRGSQQSSVIKEITLRELQIGHLSDIWSDLTETDS